jgi:hypothetical protein
MNLPGFDVGNAVNRPWWEALEIRADNNLLDGRNFMRRVG